MVTNTTVLQLGLILTAVVMTTCAVKTLRLKKIALRSRGQNPSPQLMAVLDRIDQLTSLVSDLEASVDDLHDTVNAINNTVDPPVVCRFHCLND